MSVTVQTVPKLGGWVPQCRTIKQGSVWAPKSPPHLAPGTENGRRQAKIGPKRPKTVPKPMWTLPIGLNPPSMTNDMPMERFGPWETQQRADHGPFGAVLCHFTHPKPYFGLIWAKTMTWPYLGLRGSNLRSAGTVPRYNPPLFVVSTAQNGPNAPLDRSLGCFGKLTVFLT